MVITAAVVNTKKKKNLSKMITVLWAEIIKPFDSYVVENQKSQELFVKHLKSKSPPIVEFTRKAVEEKKKVSW